MEPDWINSPHVFTCTNAWFVIRNAICMMVFPTMAVLDLFEEHPDKTLLFMGALLFFLGYEMTVRTYTRMRYLEGFLEFTRPLSRYSLLRKMTLRLVIHPDEWTVVYCYQLKKSRTYYFRKKRQAVCFVKISGMRRLENDLRTFFPERVSPGFNTEFPVEEERRLSREEPGRVF